MRKTLYIMIAMASFSVASTALGEVVYGTVSGVESDRKQDSINSAYEVVSGLFAESDYIWIKPLKVTTESTKSGRQITTIIYKAANKKRSKLSLDEQIAIQMDKEEELGIPLENRSVRGLGVPKGLGGPPNLPKFVVPSFPER